MEETDKREAILHLWQVEKLSIRQIARELHVCRKRIRAIIEGGDETAKALEKPGILDQYRQLILCQSYLVRSIVDHCCCFAQDREPERACYFPGGIVDTLPFNSRNLLCSR